MTENLDQDAEAIRSDWKAVGGYLESAVRDIAFELGGEYLAAEAAKQAESDDVLPHPDSLALLEQVEPGIGAAVFELATKKQQEAHQAGRETIERSSFLKRIRNR